MTDEQTAYINARKKLEQKQRRLSKLQTLFNRVQAQISYDKREVETLARQLVDKIYKS
jgi:Skp family chaperone for outer membrane proteins